MEETSKKVKLSESINSSAVVVGRDHYFDNAYVIDLPLDSVPDHVWQSIFERQWKLSRQLWDRKLFVVGDKLRLITTIDDLEDKLEWVKNVIERTNRDVEEYNREREALLAEMDEEERVKELEEKEKDVDTIREYLRKRIGIV